MSDEKLTVKMLDSAAMYIMFKKGFISQKDTNINLQQEYIKDIFCKLIGICRNYVLKAYKCYLIADEYNYNFDITGDILKNLFYLNGGIDFILTIQNILNGTQAAQFANIKFTYQDIKELSTIKIANVKNVRCI